MLCKKNKLIEVILMICKQNIIYIFYFQNIPFRSNVYICDSTCANQRSIVRINFLIFTLPNNKRRMVLTII